MMDRIGDGLRCNRTGASQPLGGCCVRAIGPTPPSLICRICCRLSDLSPAPSHPPAVPVTASWAARKNERWADPASQFRPAGEAREINPLGGGGPQTPVFCGYRRFFNDVWANGFQVSRGKAAKQTTTLTWVSPTRSMWETTQQNC